MSFLDETKNFGLLALIVGAINLVCAIMFFFNNNIETTWRIVGGVGRILASIVILAAGWAIFSGNIPSFMARLFPEGSTSKFGVITGYTAAVGASFIVGLGTSVGEIILGVVLGLILLLAVFILTTGKTGVIEIIIWVIFLIIYIIGIIFDAIGVFASFDPLNVLSIIGCLCECLMFIIAFIYLIDPEVRKKFGL